MSRGTRSRRKVVRCARILPSRKQRKGYFLEDILIYIKSIMGIAVLRIETTCVYALKFDVSLRRFVKRERKKKFVSSKAGRTNESSSERFLENIPIERIH